MLKIGDNLMKQKNCYDELFVEILCFERIDILTVSGGNNLTPEGDYDDDNGWNE
jgi:hypothetical protein